MGRRGRRQVSANRHRSPQSTGPIRSSIAPVELLTADQVEAIHHASLRVLQETGIEILSSRARNVFRTAGAEVDEAIARVRLDPDLVERSISTCPSEWVMHARIPTRNVPVGGNWLAYCNATTPALCQRPRS